MPHVNKKTNSEKANLRSNTVFSLYFKIRAKKFHATKPLVFSLHFLFQRDQNNYSNLTSKIMKMCEQILKKRKTTPQCKSNSSNCIKPRAPEKPAEKLRRLLTRQLKKKRSKILKSGNKKQILKPEQILKKDRPNTIQIL